MITDDYPCSCCGEKVFDAPGEYDICPNCNWEDDPFQAKNPDRSGANRMNLNEAREAYKKGREVIQDSI